MEAFKKSIVQRIPKVYNDIIKDKSNFGRNEFIYSLTELLGYVPTEFEVEELYKDKETLTCREFENVVLRKIRYIHLEQHLHNMFLKIDRECKGYITLYDLQELINNLELSDVNWPSLKDSFREISLDGIIDFKHFLDIFGTNLLKPISRSIHKYCDFDYFSEINFN